MIRSSLVATLALGHGLGSTCIDRSAIIALLPLVALLLLRFLGPHVLVIVGQSLGQTERLSFSLGLVQFGVLLHEEDPSARFLYTGVNINTYLSSRGAW